MARTIGSATSGSTNSRLTAAGMLRNSQRWLPSPPAGSRDAAEVGRAGLRRPGAGTAVAGIGRFLPFGAGGQLYAYSTRVDPRVPAAFRNDLTPLAGGLTLATVTAVLLVAAFVLFQRRDA